MIVFAGVIRWQKGGIMVGKLGFIVAMGWAAAVSAGAPVTATVQVDKPAHAVPKELYGIFFEDINYAADGGIYPELVANRGFDWQTREIEGWQKDFRGGGMARLSRQAGFPVHPNTAQYLRIDSYHPGKDGAGVGVVNHGFGGIAVKAGATYDLSFYARPHAGYDGGLVVRLENKDGEVLASYRIAKGDWRNKQPTAQVTSPLDPAALANWVKYTSVFVPDVTASDARLVVLLDGRGTVDLEFVSLFPRDTYGKRRNGLRSDLVEMLKDMKPGSLRFPGGCIVEGRDMENMYDWKRTVGPIERRPVNWNLWNYWQSHGLGFYEYFQLAEDIGAAPLPILAAGMSCQFRKVEMSPTDGLEPFIQNALDLIEFANGSPDTPWGKVRAEMGHPASFNLKYLGVGNENWDRIFLERYAVMYRAIKSKHPEIEIISSAGASAGGAMYDLAWKELPGIGADLIDEHYYVPADWLFQSTGRYDKFERKGPRVYVGEYACHLPNKANSLYAALAEAAMMTGFERNSDVVGMTAYAPLFNKIGYSQWTPDLIWFDNTRVFGTPSYYVQKLFMTHLPDVLLSTTVAAEPASLAPAGRIGVQTWNTAAEFRDLRVTRGGETLYAFDPTRQMEGWSKPQEGEWQVADGVLRQTKIDAAGTVICVGDTAWQDYTLTLKARKLAGSEGFIVRVRDSDNRFVHVNFGGWDNSQHGIEQDGMNPVVRKPGTIETGRWYDVKITLDGDRVSAWLDGQPIFEQVAIATPQGPGFYMVSGLDKQAGEIVVKCVNPVKTSRLLDLSLAGTVLPRQQARRITLTGDGDAVNDLANLTRIAPVEDGFAVSGSSVKVELQPMSLTILRFKTGSAK